ncbi:MAG: cytochrome c [Betaproteobacteria bacterium]
MMVIPPPRIVFAAAIASLLATAAFAQQPPPLHNGDAKAGKQLADKDCVACHQRQFGSATTIYTRTDRKVRTPAQLLAQVRYCNVELKAGYFPDEEEHVAAYLNEQYYKFKP